MSIDLSYSKLKKKKYKVKALSGLLESIEMQVNFRLVQHMFITREGFGAL